MKNMILIGAGGHARSCVDVIDSLNFFRVSLMVGKNDRNFKKINTVSELEFLKNYKLKKKNLLISIGQLKDGKIRKKIFDFYKSKGCNFPVIKSKTCYISKNSKVDEGTIVMHKAFINTNSHIGKNCIINNGAIIEHDVTVGNNVHIAPGAIILGGCTIKENSFIGSGSVIKQNTTTNKNFILQSGKYYNK